MKIPVIKSPHVGMKTIREEIIDWPSCPDHETSLLVRRHTSSVLLWCSEGQHFITQTNAVMKKTKAYIVGVADAGS